MDVIKNQMSSQTVGQTAYFAALKQNHAHNADPYAPCWWTPLEFNARGHPDGDERETAALKIKTDDDLITSSELDIDELSPTPTFNRLVRVETEESFTTKTVGDEGKVSEVEMMCYSRSELDLSLSETEEEEYSEEYVDGDDESNLF